MTNEKTTDSAASALSAGLGALLPCPFCGGEPKILHKGNDHTKSRSVTIKCGCCRVERTDSALRNSMDWLENMAIKQWNTRAPNVELSGLRRHFGEAPLERRVGPRTPKTRQRSSQTTAGMTNQATR